MSGITATIDSIVSDLLIICKIQIGDKVSVCGDHLDIHKEGTLQGIIRIYNGDSRSRSVSQISRVIDVAILVMSLMLESGQVRSGDHSLRYFTLIHLLSAFIKSQTGLSNLRHTYHADTLMCKQIEEIMQKQAAFITTCTTTLNIKPEEI